MAGEANTIRIGGTTVGSGTGQQSRTFINGISGVTPAGATELVVVDGNGQLGSTPSGGGSGLDADTLDMLDSTDFMPAGTDLWIDAAGDTMTGTLTTVDVTLTGDVHKSGQLFLHATGSSSTALGLRALESNSGSGNSALGYRALYSNTTGHSNTAIGKYAMQSGEDAFRNTAVGISALNSTVYSYSNTAIGASALYSNTSGSGNTAVGTSALRKSLGAANNTAIGYLALKENTSGSRNVAIGYIAGLYSTTGTDSIFIGSGAEGVAGETNTIRIGGKIVGSGVGQQNRTFINGISGVTPVGPTEVVVIDSDGQLGSSTAVLFTPRSAAPTCAAGTIYYDSEDGDFCVCKGGTWYFIDGTATVSGECGT